MSNPIQLKDKWIRISGIAGILILSMLANPAYKGPFNSMMIWRALLTVTSITLAWECNRAVILRSRTLFPNDESTVKRIAFIYIAGLLCTGVIIFCTRFISGIMVAGLSTTIKETILDASLLGVLRQYLVGPVLVFSLFVGAYEALYYYAQLKKTEEDKKRLEKEQAWSQLDHLNQQVNPHFLFNTLNALSSVVTEHPEEADKMLNETSKVYRYLLDFNKKDLVSLEDELRFIQSFFAVLQLRYGKGIALEVPEDGHERGNFLLPPLTLQLLVENAVKHNVHSKDQPLRIVISLLEGDHLQVKNNLQKKLTKPESHGIGLDNIAGKYKLLQQEAPVVKDDGRSFVVTIKLIDPAKQLAHLRPSAL